MTDDKAAADNTDARTVLKIPPDVASDITRDAAELLLDMFVADREIEEDELRAVSAAAGITLQFVSKAVSRLRGLPGFPAAMPGIALKRLVAALTDLREGKVDPVLRNDGKPVRLGRPMLPLNTQLDRVENALAMELLMAKDPQSPEDAAKEVLDLLRDSLAASLVRQWRTLHAGGDSIPAQSFKDLVELAKREVGARGLTADAYSEVIRTMLIPKR